MFDARRPRLLGVHLILACLCLPLTLGGAGCAALHREPSIPGSTLFGGSSRGASGGTPATGEAGEQEEPVIQPDRPDVTNATYTIPKDLIQVETGGLYARVPVSGEVAGTPASVRIGLANWFEGRVESEGLSWEKQAPGDVSAGFGGLTVGGKFRLWAAPAGMPVLAIVPEVTFPWGRGEDSGTDVLLRFLTGRDLPLHTHVDVNFGAAAIATGHSHFVQYMATVEGSAQIGQHWNPYVEGYWFSKLDPGGPRVFATDAGAVYTLTERFAIDAGVAFGLTRLAGHPAVFAGLSVIVGTMTGRESVHQRLREAQQRGDF